MESFEYRKISDRFPRVQLSFISSVIFCESKYFLLTRIPGYTIIPVSGSHTPKYVSESEKNGEPRNQVPDEGFESEEG